MTNYQYFKAVYDAIGWLPTLLCLFVIVGMLSGWQW